MNIVIFNENIQDKEQSVKKVYPNAIHGALKEALDAEGNHITVVTMDDENCGITRELLDNTDVLIWWSHVANAKVSDEVTFLVYDAVLRGMGFIVLHSAHSAKPFRKLMGTSCTLRWRENCRERIWVTAPGHPIAEGLPEQFTLEQEEMYGEYFDIPNPEDTVFIGWYPSGEVFRSGVTYRRGRGKVFYFQPGHETHPTFYNENVIKILKNAVNWAKPVARIEHLDCPNTEPLE